jgi:7,8-dihydropterin-6-yl-methyl-4-(beta-D-ribofuranosyl)aminobenzene 5'-phosphate synthase
MVTRGVSIGLGGLGAIAVLGSAAATRFYRGRRRAERIWEESRFPRISNPTAVRRLSILPLADWETASDDLSGEAGVSYLIRADDTTILFDLGLNRGHEHPSPLSRNMAALGVATSDVRAVVISHPHLDHTGGYGGHLSLSGTLDDLGDVPVYLPAPMEFPPANATIVDSPREIATGVFSTGPIPRQDFMLGWTMEQSLAVNVEGKGLVLIVGCGHPTVQRIVERAEALFDTPIHGLVGGLHYPITASRLNVGPLPLQRIVGTGKWPWMPVNREDVHAGISFLQARNPKLVALSSHDSCDWSVSAFREAFGSAHREVVVGTEIVA